MKAITPDNYVIRPFLTHKSQTFEYAFRSGSNPDQVSIDLAEVPPTASTWRFEAADEPLNPSGIFERPLYASLRTLFYGSESVYNRGNLFALPTDEVYVISIAQQAYGEEIRPNSFTLESGLSTASLVDDGNGHLVSSADSASIAGNVFYGLGIAVVRKASGSFTASVVSHDGIFLDSGSVLTVAFDASHTIYEHEVVCTMEAGEFNYSTNPSVTALSSSVSGNVKVLDAFASGTLTPYMTTVGLFTNLGELVAVAKFPRAIKRAAESQQSVIVRWDV